MADMQSFPSPSRPHRRSVSGWWGSVVERFFSWWAVNKTRAVRQRAAVVEFLFLYGVAVLWRNPGVSGNYPLCPIYHLTGCYCPGCGAMRASRAFLTGDFASVITYNVLFLPALFLVVWWCVTGVLNGSGKTRNIWVGVAVVAVFTVLRNIPAGSFLAPHPA